MSDLKFLGYRVPKIDFSIGDQFGSGPVQLDVNIKRSVEDEQHLQDKGGTSYTLVLSATIGDENNHNGICAKVTLAGGFQSTSDTNLMVNNATAILFPYLRNAISSICVTAGIPPFILPTVNVASDFNDEFSNN